MEPSGLTAYMPLFALIVTLSLIATTTALVLTNHTVPDEIKTGDALAFAWFFISSAQRGTARPGGGE